LPVTRRSTNYKKYGAAHQQTYVIKRVDEDFFEES